VENKKTTRDLILENDNESRDRALDQLCRFAATLGTSLDVKTLVEDSLEPLLAMSKANSILIALSNTDAHTFYPVANLNWEPEPIGKSIPASQIATLGTEAIAFESIDELNSSLSNKLSEIKSPFAIMPLWAHAHLRGVAILLRKEITFSSSTLKLLTASGRQLALAVENSQLLTDLQQSYKKLMDTQEELISAERLAALGQLSATMAHEIRNPLATIFSAISQIRKHSQTDDISATLLDIAEEEAARLNSMVSGLLEFARPRKPGFEERSVIEIVNLTIKNQDIPQNITCSIFDDSKNMTVSLDPDLIQRAIELLIENAVQSMENTGGEIRVHVLDDKENNGAVIEISDDGEGITPEAMGKVFEPFFSTKPSGTGLGLSTVKRISEDHSGTLEISSKPGTGTTVRLSIKVTNNSYFQKE